MNIEGCVALVTGANGGIGSALVRALLQRGAARVYLGARRLESLSALLPLDEGRLVAVRLDVTSQDDIDAAAALASDTTLLINNAGYMSFRGAIAAADMADARREMEVNYFAPLALCRAFAPVLAAAGGGTIVNVLSMAALVSLPVTGTYSASKAAFLSVTRSIRAEVAAKGTAVVGVLAAQTETAMGLRLPPPRVDPADVASETLDAVQAGINDEFAAGDLSKTNYALFQADPTAFQAKVSLLLPK